MHLLKRATEVDPKNKFAWNNPGSATSERARTIRRSPLFRSKSKSIPTTSSPTTTLGPRLLAGAQIRRGGESVQQAAGESIRSTSLPTRIWARCIPSGTSTTWLSPELEKASSLTPDSRRVAGQAGRCLSESRPGDKALATFDHAVELKPLRWCGTTSLTSCR